MLIVLDTILAKPAMLADKNGNTDVFASQGDRRRDKGERKQQRISMFHWVPGPVGSMPFVIDNKTDVSRKFSQIRPTLNFAGCATLSVEAKSGR